MDKSKPKEDEFGHHRSQTATAADESWQKLPRTPDLCIWEATEDRYINKGAYIVLEPPTFDNPVIRSFEEITPRPQNCCYCSDY